MFITFEGTEGSGKSINVAWLAEWLEEHGHQVLTTREPGGTEVGEKIRSILLHCTGSPSAQTSLLLFEAARSQLVEEVIRPALASGVVVLSDRFTDSTLAYQGYGEGLSLGHIGMMNNIATGGLTPDLTVLLDIDPREGLARRLDSAEWNAIDARELAFHEKVRNGFLAMAAAEPARWLVLDATESLQYIRERIVARLALWQNERKG
ncbi:MAG: tmk [Chloroflexi bacterium]|nr:tmk [Chloroflexota bacterium]MDB5074663.1 tmk [Chloroflexota bacterium]